ncbi:MAG: SDR family oxidoreductase [Actinobacteria bacterium]|nr:SDR family oxidoreductase [Actinomycetota bacterium]
MDFDGRAVLVTGSSRGIGAAIATRLAGLGARVAVHYRTGRDAAGAVVSGLPGDGHVAVGADVADPAEVAGMVDRVVDAVGGIDVLVNNAGVYIRHPLDEVSYETWQVAWREVLATNLIGAANVTWCVARHMIGTGRAGRIVNVSSRGAFRGEPDHPAYGASKAALNSMGQSLAQHLAPHGITVTTVAPGFVETDMAAPLLAGPQGEAIRAQSPLGRVATADEIAGIVAFLASDDAVIATGAIVDANGASYLRT